MNIDDRIARVRARSPDNLSGDLSLDRLADVAALSRFHYRRVYAWGIGETLAETVRRGRLNRAAVLVAATRTPPPDIARAVAEGTDEPPDTATPCGFRCRARSSSRLAAGASSPLVAARVSFLDCPKPGVTHENSAQIAGKLSTSDGHR